MTAATATTTHSHTIHVSDASFEADDRGWSLPLILKPDVGMRGTGVRLIRAWDQAGEYLAVVDASVIAQPYHPGPFEAGIFYYRMPGSPHGRIFSITAKQFPLIVGDGTSTVESLILSHPRYRLQAARFAARHGGRVVGSAPEVAAL